MNIHEYQAKAMLKEFGAPVPRGGIALKQTTQTQLSCQSSLKD